MDNNLLLVPYTLSQFCYTAKRLLEGEDIPLFVRFVLTGIHEGSQVVLDPIQDRLSDDHPITARRDYDSLLGVDRDIKVRAPLTLFPKAQNFTTLKKNIYIKYSFENAHGPHTVPIHKIPNVCIGKWNVHNTLRVLIPGLYSQDRSSVLLDDEERTIFCEKGFWPAVRDVMGDSADDWPPDYRSEAFRETNGKNHAITQSKMMPEWCVSELADSIRYHLYFNQVPWGEGLCILHQIQGVKNSSVHRLEADSAEVALEEFLDINNLRSYDLDSGHWWIDVGLEITSRLDECLAWRTDSHTNIVMDIADIPENEALRVTSIGSSQYTRDMTSHIPALSGCRITPGSRAQGPFNIHYLQLYLTDKSVTARKDGTHHGNYITGKDILAGKAEMYLEGLYDLYRKAVDRNISHARAEVRVPIQHATKCLLDLDHESLRGSLVSFPKSVWWGLRAYRCLAFLQIIQRQAEAPVDFRVKPSALLLTASAPWFLNSLHCTPDSGPASRDLITAVLPHVLWEDADPNALPFSTSTRSRNDYDNDDRNEMTSDIDSDYAPPQHLRPVRRANANTVPYISYGILFLRPIRIGIKYPVPRFSHAQGLFIKDTTFKYIFSEFIEDAQSTILSKRFSSTNLSRVSNKTRRTKRYVKEQEDESIDFNLSRRGYALKAKVTEDGGSDMDVDDTAEVRTFLPIDDEITWLWRQFLRDITNKSPNMKSTFAHSYCKLSELEREDVDESTYQNTNLAVYFHDCQWKVGSSKDWDDTFNRLWPLKDCVKSGKVQNFSSTIYYPKWVSILDSSSDRTISGIRKAIQERFDSLYWMPQAQSDRIWYTKFHEDYKKSSGIRRGEASPRVLVRHIPEWFP